MSFTLNEITWIRASYERFQFKISQALYDAEKILVKLVLHESLKDIEKIEFNISSELADLNIDDTVQKWRKLYTKHKNYEKVLERWWKKKRRKIKEKEKQKTIAVLDERLKF